MFSIEMIQEKVCITALNPIFEHDCLRFHPLCLFGPDQNRGEPLNNIVKRGKRATIFVQHARVLSRNYHKPDPNHDNLIP